MDGLIQVDGSDPVTSVLYEYAAEVRDVDTWVPLPVVGIAPSADLDRVPYAAATVTLGPVDNHTWELLDARTVDPRRGGQVRWRLRQLDAEGTLLGRLPVVRGAGDEWAIMWVRTAARTLDVTTITLGGGETMIDDILVIEEDRFWNIGEVSEAVLGGARDLGDVVNNTLYLVFGSIGEPVAVGEKAAAAALIPTLSFWSSPGMDIGPDLPAGTSLMQVIEPELSAAGCRLIDLWGVEWALIDRDLGRPSPASPETLRWSSYEVPGTTAVDPVILGFSETVSRDGDWGDTVVVEGGYDGQEWQHFAKTGVGSKGQIIKSPGAQPSANLAASIAGRAFRRGHDISIIATIRLNVAPGCQVEVYLRSGILVAEITSVSWSAEDGTMTVHARSAQKADLNDEQMRVAPPSMLERAQELANSAYSRAVEASAQQIATYDRAKNQEMRRGFRGTF